jgi:hypothetical protein
MGLASQRESAGEVKERRKPGRPWQSGDTVAGSSPFGTGERESARGFYFLDARKRSSLVARKRLSRRSTCRWKAFRFDDPGLL